MLKEIEKTFGRKIIVDLVDMKTQMTPCIGFEGDRPAIQYVQMPFDKFGVKIMGTEPIDVVVRIDNKVVAQRARLEAKAIHVISRGDDGKPFVFTRPGEKPKHSDEKAPGYRHLVFALGPICLHQHRMLLAVLRGVGCLV